MADHLDVFQDSGDDQRLPDIQNGDFATASIWTQCSVPACLQRVLCMTLPAAEDSHPVQVIWCAGIEAYGKPLALLQWVSLCRSLLLQIIRMTSSAVFPLQQNLRHVFGASV
jgi:hypothetical protein